MTTSRLHNASRQQLCDLINDLLKEGIIASFEEICSMIFELKTRCKFNHELIGHSMFRFYAEVRNGRLTGAMVYALGGNKRMLSHMEGRPKDFQNELAGGKLVTIVTTSKSEIVERDKAVIDMTYSELARAFPAGKSPATIGEQRSALEAELASKPKAHVPQQPVARADGEKQTFSLGGQTVPLNVILGALREIGLEVRGLSKLVKETA